MAAETMAEAVMHRLQRGALQQLAQLVVNISIKNNMGWSDWKRSGNLTAYDYSN